MRRCALALLITACASSPARVDEGATVQPANPETGSRPAEATRPLAGGSSGGSKLERTLASAEPALEGDDPEAGRRAVGTLTAAIEKESQSSAVPAAMLALGRSPHVDLQRRIQSLFQLIKRFPRAEQVPAAYFALGEALEALQKPRKAMKAYERACAMHLEEACERPSGLE